MNKALSIITLALWIALFFCDRALTEEYNRALTDESITFGELYGPLSFFKRWLMVGALVASATLTLRIWRKKN